MVVSRLFRQPARFAKAGVRGIAKIAKNHPKKIAGAALAAGAVVGRKAIAKAGRKINKASSELVYNRVVKPTWNKLQNAASRDRLRDRERNM